MTDGDALLHAVVANPDDDTPRLVYADWLQENGDQKRAEFIRLQCELARLPTDDPRRPALVAREATLLGAHRGEWLGVVAELAPETQFRRGFAELTELALWTSWLTASRFGPARATPMTEDRALRLAASPHALWLTKLDVTCVPLGDATAQAFAASRYLTRLRELRLGGEPEYIHVADRGRPRLTADGVRALAASPVLAGLTTLDLSCHGCGDSGAQALAESPYLARLDSLDLRWDNISEAGIEALIASPNLPRLTRLGLTGNPDGPYEVYLYDWDGSYAHAERDEAAVTILEARFENRLRIF